MDTFSLLVRKTNKPTWKEELPSTDSEDAITEFCDKVLKNHAHELKGSFQIVTKKNGGSSGNVDGCFTVVSNHKGELEYHDFWERID